MYVDLNLLVGVITFTFSPLHCFYATIIEGGAAQCIYIYIYVKRQKAVYRLVTAPQGGTQKYTLAFAYDSPR